MGEPRLRRRGATRRPREPADLRRGLTIELGRRDEFTLPPLPRQSNAEQQELETKPADARLPHEATGSVLFCDRHKDTEPQRPFGGSRSSALFAIAPGVARGEQAGHIRLAPYIAPGLRQSLTSASPHISADCETSAVY